MPAEKMKDLHLANSLNELNEKYECELRKMKHVLKNKTSVQLSKSAKKLLESAELERIEGDEENSYIFYMKYLGITTHLQKAPDYRQNKQAILENIQPKTVSLVLDIAENIKKSLEKRYEDKRQLERLFEHENHNLLRLKIDQDRERAKKKMELIIPKNDVVPVEEQNTISVKYLYELLKNEKSKVLILDVRPGEDYRNSSIARKPHVLYINIPQEKIIPGNTPDKIIRNLPHETIAVWNKRSSVDLVVLMDWSSVTIDAKTNIGILHDGLLKWDIGGKYKKKPVILEGGYESWLLHYPTMTTNPHAIPPNINSSLDDLLDDVNYPSLIDTPTEKKPPPFQNGSPSFVPQINRDVKAPSVNVSNQTVDVPKNPIVDRSKKAAALEVYDKRAMEKKMLMEQNEKLANDSFSLEKERMVAEENWEKIHDSHEREAEEGKKESLQLKQDELQSILLQLESKQNDMNLEIAQVKKQLTDLKSKEETEVPAVSAELSPVDVNTVLEESKKALEIALEKEKKIKEIEQEQAEIAHKRELLQQEREKKLAEARAQKRYKQMEETENEMVPLKDGESTTGFKRSHSSPNIAQMDEPSMKVKAPHFDRNVKPSFKTISPSDYNQARQRDFQGVLGCMGRGLTGLKNLGNTCYMNSIMQCLSNTADLAMYFCGDTYREDVRGALISSKGNNGTRGAIAEEVAAVVKALHSGQFRFISAKDLRNAVGRHQVMFRGFEQQDSHEFLTILMDWLHNDLQTPTRQQIQMESLPASEKAWLEYTKSKESLILKLFYGQIKSTLRCLTCNNTSVTHDSFSNLSLELPPHANKCTLNDCLELYLKDERISDWNCTTCKQKREALKKLDISRLPPILVIHFKRFYLDPKDYIANSFKKKLTNIDFPLYDMNMGQYMGKSSRNRKNTMYNLYGVSNHYGSMEGGHYTAYCKSSVYSKWYKFDDHIVTEISHSDVKSSAAYILFYSSLPEN